MFDMLTQRKNMPSEHATTSRGYALVPNWFVTVRSASSDRKVVPPTLFVSQSYAV